MLQWELTSLDTWFCSGHIQWYIYKQRLILTSVSCKEMRRISVSMCVSLIKDRMFPNHSVSENFIWLSFFTCLLNICCLCYSAMCEFVFLRTDWDNNSNYWCLCCLMTPYPWASGVPGGLGCSNPPQKNLKALQNRAKLNPIVLLKIAEFRMPAHQDIRKKSSKIPKLPRFAIVLHYQWEINWLSS